MRHLAQGVGGSVGAARTDGAHRFSQKGLQGASEFALHSAAAGLDLPADKIRAVVFQEQANGAPWAGFVGWGVCCVFC